MSNLTSADMNFLSTISKEAESSRWGTVIIKTPMHSLTKQHVFDYYSQPQIRAAILRQLKEGPAVVYQNFSHEEPVLRRWVSKDIPIHVTKDSGEVEDPSDYNYWIERRATEFHPTLGPTTKRVFVDIDPGSAYDWKKTKEVTGRVADTLYSHPNIKDIELRFSGGTGFYVLGELEKEMPTDDARKLVQDLIAPMLVSDKSLTADVASKNKLRLDTSTLHNMGSIRGLYSLNQSTGLVSVPVEHEHLTTFEPEHATINAVLGGNPKRYKPIRQ